MYRILGCRGRKLHSRGVKAKKEHKNECKKEQGEQGGTKMIPLIIPAVISIGCLGALAASAYSIGKTLTKEELEQKSKWKKMDEGLEQKWKKLKMNITR